MPSDKKPAVKALRVEEMMTIDVVAVTPVMTLKEVVKLFLERRISGAPVIDQNGNVISVISQTDLIQFIALDGMAGQVNQYLKKLPKTENVVSVRKTDLFRDVFKEFLIKPVRRIIVVDDNGRLQGIVSKSNLLKAFLIAGG
jgi:predicted transcriptional regulator